MSKEEEYKKDYLTFDDMFLCNAFVVFCTNGPNACSTCTPTQVHKIEREREHKNRVVKMRITFLLPLFFHFHLTIRRKNLEKCIVYTYKRNEHVYENRCLINIMEWIKCERVGPINKGTRWLVGIIK